MEHAAIEEKHDPDDWITSALDQYERPLVAYCLRIVRDVEVARDVVQDAFMRLIEQEPSSVSDHLAEWLFTVCRNRCVDVLRKERRMNQLDEATPVTSGNAKPASDEQCDETREALLQMLDALPQRQQDVIRLKFLGGLSYREISRVTDLSVSNVGFLIHTGLKSIRERLSTTEHTRTQDLGMAR